MNICREPYYCHKRSRRIRILRKRTRWRRYKILPLIVLEKESVITTKSEVPLKHPVEEPKKIEHKNIFQVEVLKRRRSYLSPTRQIFKIRRPQNSAAKKKIWRKQRSTKSSKTKASCKKPAQEEVKSPQTEKESELSKAENSEIDSFDSEISDSPLGAKPKLQPTKVYDIVKTKQKL